MQLYDALSDGAIKWVKEDKQKCRKSLDVLPVLGNDLCKVHFLYCDSRCAVFKQRVISFQKSDGKNEPKKFKSTQS